MAFPTVSWQQFRPELASMLLTLLNAFTMTGTWPDCQLKATVSLLSKVEVPETAANARPISILGTVVQLWGKIMAGKMLRHLMAVVPDGVFGSIPTRSCADLAFLLQTAIEDSLFNENPLVGCSMDLTKAFNVISRPVLQTLATRLGWPHEVLCSYMNFIGGLQRFWSVGGGIHGPVCSSWGVPEGDPIAVVTMVCVTVFISADLELTHVDNWSFQASLREVQAAEHVTTVTGQISMAMAMNKMKFYSTQGVETYDCLQPSGVSCSRPQRFGCVFLCCGKAVSKKLPPAFSG